MDIAKHCVRLTMHATNVRYGAFLRSIPLEMPVGDHVHCAARVANAIFKRIITVVHHSNNSQVKA